MSEDTASRNGLGFATQTQTFAVFVLSVTLIVRRNVLLNWGTT
jgi:hypothetical protein